MAKVVEHRDCLDDPGNGFGTEGGIPGKALAFPQEIDLVLEAR